MVVKSRVSLSGAMVAGYAAVPVVVGTFYPAYVLQAKAITQIVTYFLLISCLAYI